jgi:NodT family efflux transporter outer membrane factor (OMF) lipoprotein
VRRFVHVNLPSCLRVCLALCLLTLALAPSGCTSLPEYIRNGFKVGPNYVEPPAPVAKEWIDANDKRVSQDPTDVAKWWKVFNDPVLDDLICDAYKQNLTLREAGYRILQARAQLGIAVGNFFPQTQSVTGNYATTEISSQTATGQLFPQPSYGQWNYGFNLAWEVDFWGRFRRAIESGRANLEASVHDYDDVLVTLLSDVATSYVIMRVTEQRIEYARANVKLQNKTWEIAKARINVDPDGELSVDQARTLLKQTEATVPAFEITLRQTTNQLCILLGIPPEDLRKKLGAAKIPSAPPEVVVGVPADLLRRRPDVRKAERLAAAQSAQIGYAESALYPHFSITGNIGYSADQFKNLFTHTALAGTVGPSFEWDVLNYGRLLNNVRLQDATFKQLVTAYQQTVLTAQQETENGLVTFLKSQLQTSLQNESAEYAAKGETNVRARYELGLENFTRVTQLQQLLVQEQDLLAQAQGQIALGLIQVYKGLGGGWQLRQTGCDANPATVQPAAENIPAPAAPAKLGQPF